jgi:molybdopterin converting factor small subunit
MAVEVSIPTILRSYTDGAKSVEAAGSTLEEAFKDLDARPPGLADRLVEDGALRRFVNVYVNDEDVRFLDGLTTPLADGDEVTILPAVAGGAPAPLTPSVIMRKWPLRKGPLAHDHVRGTGPLVHDHEG